MYNTSLIWWFFSKSFFHIFASSYANSVSRGKYIFFRALVGNFKILGAVTFHCWLGLKIAPFHSNFERKLKKNRNFWPPTYPPVYVVFECPLMVHIARADQIPKKCFSLQLKDLVFYLNQNNHMNQNDLVHIAFSVKSKMIEISTVQCLAD